MKSKNKHENKVKTFTIPSDMGLSRKNINNIDLNTSDEQIINKAIMLHSQGDILEAIKCYKYCIKKELDDSRVFSNYGIILKSMGQLKEAEKYIRKAIQINPNNPEAYSNLGNIFRDLGRLKEAEKFHRKAIEIRPDLADAYLNLGNILKDLGKYSEALKSYMIVINIDDSISNIYTLITNLLKDSDPSQLDQSKLRHVLSLLIERDDIAHDELFKSFSFLYKNEIKQNKEILEFESYQIDSFLNDRLKIKSLKKIIFREVIWEEILGRIRKYICLQVVNEETLRSYKLLSFTCALAEQCFMNEYIYSFTSEETIAINKILDRCSNCVINDIDISILACYFPLYTLIDRIPSLKSIKSTFHGFEALIKLQILEPIKEKKLSESILKLGSIKNDISKKVKSQYEENPYPRWRYGRYVKQKKFSSISIINHEIKPNVISSYNVSKKLDILVAGCGTGNQLLQAQIFKNAEIIGIDLSLSSLSYAKRKLDELDIKNVKLVQMDILEINLLHRKFDIILCSGVLHHMQNPLIGFNALLGALKSNGFMKLGLYSELARQDVVAAKKYIETNGMKSTEKDIRLFRQRVIEGISDEIDSLKLTTDFFSMSMCRDLCFHAEEHRFTIDQIEEIMSLNKLNFLGFMLPKSVKSIYNNYFPEDKRQTNLYNWQSFEEKHPHTFRGMYQFWVQRAKRKIVEIDRNIF